MIYRAMYPLMYCPFEFALLYVGVFQTKKKIPISKQTHGKKMRNVLVDITCIVFYQQE